MTPYLCIASSKDGPRTRRVGTVAGLFSEGEDEGAGAPQRGACWVAALRAGWQSGRTLVYWLGREAEARQRQHHRTARTVSAW